MRFSCLDNVSGCRLHFNHRWKWGEAGAGDVFSHLYYSVMEYDITAVFFSVYP